MLQRGVFVGSEEMIRGECVNVAWCRRHVTDEQDELDMDLYCESCDEYRTTEDV